MASADILHADVFFRQWFLDYGSYVILQRAVPHIADGLKPVQRRILHALREMDDGRLNKVANAVGQAMRYHPHGDSSIFEAMVGLGQKGFLLDTQGNWGNILTGDGAAAGRYIECRLSKFAKDVLFNDRLTAWIPSYDGRGKEPVTLPAKFPLLLLQGVEGIAVGLACKTLPHNFNEICDAAVACIKGEPFVLIPDFPTGGTADVRAYNDGKSGGRVRVRATIAPDGKHKLVISDLPFGVTAPSLMESIEAAVTKEKIKIKKIDDVVAKHVRIVLHLPADSDIEQTTRALYAFTSCEVSHALNSVAIQDGQPRFLGASDVLRACVESTGALIEMELKMRLEDLELDWHSMMLERIFIENELYALLKSSESIEQAVECIRDALGAHAGSLRRPVSTEDIEKLTEIRFKRLSKFDSSRAQKAISDNEAQQADVKKRLKDIHGETIAHFQRLKKVYGTGKERKTQIAEFENFQAASVAASNVKLYVNREEGFAGFGMKKDELLCDCSDIDDVMVIGRKGWMKVNRITQKGYFGTGISYAGIWRKGDPRVFNMVYRDGKTGVTYAKRFLAGAVTRDREYSLTKSADSEVLHISVSPSEEAPPPKVMIKIHTSEPARRKEFELDFSTISVKGREAGGNTISKYRVRAVVATK